MALLSTEIWLHGFVVSTVDHSLRVTTDRTGATFRGGFLRDPDGRLVVVVV